MHHLMDVDGTREIRKVRSKCLCLVPTTNRLEIMYVCIILIDQPILYPNMSAVKELCRRLSRNRTRKSEAKL